MLGCLAADGDFGAVDLEHARVAERRTARSRHHQAWQKAKLHETARIVFGQVNYIEDGGLAGQQVG